LPNSGCSTVAARPRGALVVWVMQAAVVPLTHHVAEMASAAPSARLSRAEVTVRNRPFSACSLCRLQGACRVRQVLPSSPHAVHHELVSQMSAKEGAKARGQPPSTSTKPACMSLAIGVKPRGMEESARATVVWGAGKWAAA